MTETYSGQIFKARYYTPLVYCWLRNGEYLYIGKCYYGFHRVIFNKAHSVFKRENIEDTDTIEIHYFETNEECLKTEKAMIKKYKSLYNFKQGPKREGESYKDDVLTEILPSHTPKLDDVTKGLLRDIRTKGIKWPRKKKEY